MPDVDWKAQLIDQIDFAWDHHFVPHMKGMKDTEYLWEPVDDVWTVYPGEDIDDPAEIDEQREVSPAPFTTIAWRMHHMASFFNERWVDHFGDPETDSRATPVSLSIEGGMAVLRAAYERWKGSLESMPEDRLAQPCGPAEGPYSEAPFAMLVLHINREFIHHAAECCLIRDLYRQRKSLTRA